MRNEAREVVAAISLAAHSSMISLEEMVDALGPHLVSTADRISARLGYRRDDEQHAEPGAGAVAPRRRPCRPVAYSLRRHAYRRQTHRRPALRLACSRSGWPPAAARTASNSFKGEEHEVAQTIANLQTDASAGDQQKICSNDLAGAGRRRA